MKDLYLYILETFHSFEDQLGPEERYRVFYLKEAASILFDRTRLVDCFEIDALKTVMCII